DQRVCVQPPVRLLYMELVPGGTLQDVVRRWGEVQVADRTGRLMLDVVDLNLASSGIAPPEGSDIRRRLVRTNWYEAVCEIGLRLVQGLAYAHDKGVLHRDIKPANVLLTPECSPKLADFNISFQDGREDEQAEDAFGGSLAYMSPEQLEACHPALGGSPHKVREASDIYSVGIILFELTSGERPFGDLPPDQRWSLTLQRMIDQRRMVDFEQLDANLPSDCPLSLRTVLIKCLQPAENLRYRSARQLANALKLCLHPRLWNLLREPTSWFGRLPLRFPVFTVLMLTLIPSILAAVFNFFYNQHAIIEKLGNAKSLFMTIQAGINAVAFPVGMAIVVWCAMQTKRQMQSAPGANHALWCALFLGQQMARIALALWVLSGFAYPIAIHWGLKNGVGVGMYVHFALSLALCGMLAGTYPFFFVTAVGIRWFVPEMIRQENTPGPVGTQLEKLRRLNRLYLLLTASVPLFGILLMVMFGFRDGEQDLSIYLLIASVTGLFGFGAMFALHRMIEDDLTALDALAVDDEM
ncbi:MAG: serine/threonine protein kinase, partial [Planctomycetales bacterium]|nr:serine/threonine protein kinase [Planctomycetales bacterium]